MKKQELEQLLQSVAAGTTSVEQAVLAFKKEPYQDLDYAKVDLHRELRQGAAEVIYGAGYQASMINHL